LQCSFAYDVSFFSDLVMKYCLFSRVDLTVVVFVWFAERNGLYMVLWRA